MKLQSFQNMGFKFSLLFADGKTIRTDLRPLIGAYLGSGSCFGADRP
uniref:Uncharacterized protein n=1 Tax=Candidatus Kentrum sp. UNK TaxID=2126344 RepID=A0A451B540_9GAMM|nr:MAG: hypothetical protein BECKUNK1418G_GA0071005_12003 [Candidatus Kentron sp. UNK]VFK73381.1 MAG: hypothetical protein BECKUNK1418H_GA0071006_11953 [Candidatus Kentron sp. UNK]